MKVFETLIDEVQQELQDTAGTTYGDTEVAVQLEDAIREVSDYSPYIMKMTFSLESRTGTDTAGDTKKLTDSSGQFLSTDADKVIYNTTDETWATVVSYDDANTLSISKDIMASGEGYKMFNKGCVSEKQLNLEDAGSYLRIDKFRVEFPIQQDPREYRNVNIDGDIATIDYYGGIEDSSSGTADVDVSIWFAKCHNMSQLTDLEGTVNGTVLAGAKTFTVAAVGTGTEEIAEDVEFTVAGVRGTYRIYTDMTLASGGGVIVFRPKLESAPADGAVVTFTGSTLDRQLERLVVELVAAKCLISKSLSYVTTVNVGGADVARQLTATGHDKLAVVRDELSRLVKPKTKRVWPKE